jgi:hypothetical protein
MNQTSLNEVIIKGARSQDEDPLLIGNGQRPMVMMLSSFQYDLLNSAEESLLGRHLDDIAMNYPTRFI